MLLIIEQQNIHTTHMRNAVIWCRFGTLVYAPTIVNFVFTIVLAIPFLLEILYALLLLVGFFWLCFGCKLSFVCILEWTELLNLLLVDDYSVTNQAIMLTNHGQEI